MTTPPCLGARPPVKGRRDPRGWGEVGPPRTGGNFHVVSPRPPRAVAVSGATCEPRPPGRGGARELGQGRAGFPGHRDLPAPSASSHVPRVGRAPRGRVPPARRHRPPSRRRRSGAEAVPVPGGGAAGAGGPVAPWAGREQRASDQRLHFRRADNAPARGGTAPPAAPPGRCGVCLGGAPATAPKLGGADSDPRPPPQG